MAKLISGDILDEGVELVGGCDDENIPKLICGNIPGYGTWLEEHLKG
jgi:hypothetical protein